MKIHAFTCATRCDRGGSCDCYVTRGGEPPDTLTQSMDNQMVCPMCGEVHSLCDLDYDMPAGGDIVECHGCEKKFMVADSYTMWVSSTRKLDAPPPRKGKKPKKSPTDGG